MAELKDALVSLEGSLKVGGIAALKDALKDGGALDIAIQVEVAKGGTEGAIAAVVGPIAKQFLLGLVDKI